MDKLPHYLEAALSFRSITDLNKRYSKFLDGITVGYEAEISGGDLGDNENSIDEHAEIESFIQNFSWSEQQYLTRITASMSVDEILDKFEITPIYGFFSPSTDERRALITKLRTLHFRVVGLPMQNGDPIMEEPDLHSYPGYNNQTARETFATRDTRLINVNFALKTAQGMLQTMQSIHQEYPITSHTSSYAVESIAVSVLRVMNNIKKLQELKSSSDEIEVRRVIYNIGESIYKYYKGWHEIFAILNAQNTHYFFVYDADKLIVMLNATKNDDSGLQSNLLEWSDDGKEHFEEDYGLERSQEESNQVQEHLEDVRSGLNEDDSTVVDKIHTLVVNNVDEDAELSQGYHQSDNLKGKVTVVEGDSSISPAGAEVVSPIFQGLQPSFKWLDDVFDMIEDNGLETNSSTGLHVNIGTFKSLARVKNPELDNPFFSMQPTIDVVKLAVLSGDHYLLDQFGRFGNTYAQSLASNIRDLASANFDFKAIQKSGMLDLLIKLNKQFLTQQTDRYRTINMQHLLDNGYLEFRIAGNTDYHKDKAKVKKAIYRYVQLCAVACDPKAYFKEYMTELYRLFVGSSTSNSVTQETAPRPKNVQEAMYIVRAWSSKYMENGHGALPAAPKDRIRDAIAKGQSAFESDVLDMIAGIDTKLYPKVDANFLYAIRMLMLYSVKDKPNPKKYLIDTWNTYKDTSIKNYLAPKMYRNKPQWLKFFYTGTMSNSDMPKGGQ